MAKPVVLIVEDDPIWYSFLEAALGAEGYSLIRANGTKSALDIANRQTVDLALVDIIMARVLAEDSTLEGVALLERLQEIGIKCMVVTIRASEKVRRVIDDKHIGIVDYVTKTWDDDDLRDRVRRALQEGRSDDRGRSREANE